MRRRACLLSRVCSPRCRLRSTAVAARDVARPRIRAATIAKPAPVAAGNSLR
jgi:hypothetical protein